MFGGQTDEAEAGQIIASAHESGVNFLDTSDVYHRGEAESLTGRLIAGRRADWVVATKVGNRMGRGPNEGGLGRRWIVSEVEESLRRLGTEWIDLYYFHMDDFHYFEEGADVGTPLEESLRAIEDVIRQGKVRYLGLSNFRAWRIAEAIRQCERIGMPRPVACQPLYNAMNRMAEVEVLPACGFYGIGVVPYSPLARGVLTGKYDPDSAPGEDTRAGRKDKRMMETEFRRDSLVLARKIKERADEKGFTSGQFALAWVLANRYVSSVIAGPRTIEHWTDYLGALSCPITAEDEAFIDDLVTPGHPSTPGFNDPHYPLTGR